MESHLLLLTEANNGRNCRISIIFRLDFLGNPESEIHKNHTRFFLYQFTTPAENLEKMYGAVFENGTFLVLDHSVSFFVVAKLYYC